MFGWNCHGGGGLGWRFKSLTDPCRSGFDMDRRGRLARHRFGQSETYGIYSRPMTAVAESCRRFGRLWLVALLFVLTAASCDPPGNTASTPRDRVSQLSTPGFAEGPINRRVLITIPDGALERAIHGEARLGVWTSSDPFSAVEFQLSDPVEGLAVVGRPGNRGFGFDWKLPTDCVEGCDVTVPITITHIGEGNSPDFDWSMSFSIGYDGVAADLESHSFSAEILPAD